MRRRNGCPSILSITGSTNDISTFRSDPQNIKQSEASIANSEAIQPTVFTLPAALQQNATTTLTQPRLYAAQTLVNPTIPLPIDSQRPLPANPLPISLALQPQQALYSSQQLPLATQQPLLTADTIQSLQQLLLPFLESTAANLANYLTATQGGIPIPQIASTQVRTTYPTFYSNLQTLPQQQQSRQ